MSRLESAIRIASFSCLVLSFGCGTSGSGSGGGGYQAPADACALLTDSEVSATLAKDVESMMFEHDEFVAQCGWEPQGILSEIYLVVYANPNGQEDWAGPFLNTLRDATEDETVDVAGLGDEAFSATADNGVSVVWRGDNDYVVILSVAPTETMATTDGVVDLAFAVDGRMP